MPIKMYNSNIFEIKYKICKKKTKIENKILWETGTLNII